MDDWSKRFNALPKEVRFIACAVGHQQRIRDLERDKKRIKANCASECVELDELIKRIQKGIDDIPSPPEAP